jgi:hypothetical protein
MNPTPEDLQTFESAFDTHCGGCRRTCECGKEFFDGANSYDWDTGELEALRADPDSVELGYSIGTISFEGREYVMDCTCWHERARKIKGFIDGHSRKIAEYLTLEKNRKQEEADESPVVN